MKHNTIKELYDEIRYNKNTKGMPLSVEDGKPNKKKKHMGAIGILGAMSTLGYYDEAAKETDGKLSNIVKQMIENSKEFVNDRGIKL
jgi:hypothetical protein